MKIQTNNRMYRGCRYGGDNEYEVVANCEMLSRGHEDDPRFGVCISKCETELGALWQTHEYNAEEPDRYYSGHYFMRDEISAWQDYFHRCKEVADYVEKWDRLKRDM